ncbi:MAG: glycosyltransferase family 9 protein [Coriobacteriia bacterium]|nr:glycosyltransferase family 9 protein [Coriobacteriia bacterium]
MAEELRRIAVLRANGIGDLVFALPALCALKEAHPRSRLTLLGLPWHEDFLRGRPGPVDRVVVVPRYRGVRSDGPPEPGAQRRFFAQMRHERFDVAVQMHGGGRHSNPFVSSLGAGLTAGLRGADAPALDRWVPYRLYQPEHVRYLEVAALLGADETLREPEVEVTDDDRLETQAVLARRLDAGAAARPLVAMNPGAGDARRRWPVKRFAEVGDGLARAGATVVLTGAAPDALLTVGVREAMREKPVDLAGRLSLGGVCALYARCAVVVSNDSGPLHLAAAVGAPTVGIFWAGNVITAALPTRSRHRYAISWRLACPTCGADCMRSDCAHEDSFVADVSASEVLGEALDLLEATEREGVALRESL